MIEEKIFKCLISSPFEGIDSIVTSLAQEIENGYTIYAIEYSAMNLSAYGKIREPNLIITLRKKGE